MKVNRAKLVEVLKAIQPGLAAKETIDYATSFIFKEGLVFTYNDEISVSHPVDFDITGAIAAKEFYTLLTKLPDDEVELSIGESCLILNAGKTSAEFPFDLSPNTKEIEAALGKAKSMKAIPKAFLAGIKLCVSSTGKDMTRPLLTCIHCDKAKMMASDSFRLSVFDMDGDIDEMNIPGSALSILKNYVPTKYATTKGWIHFQTEGGAVFSCRTVVGDFPAAKIEKFAADAANGEEVQFPDELAEMLERAGIFSVNGKAMSDNAVNIIVGKNKLTVKSGGGRGKIEEVSRIRYKGADIDILINPTYLQDILAITKKATIGETTIRFDADGFVYVVLLMKG